MEVIRTPNAITVSSIFFTAKTIPSDEVTLAVNDNAKSEIGFLNKVKAFVRIEAFFEILNAGNPSSPIP